MLKSETIKAALAELAESRLQLDIQESELRTQLKHAELQEARLRFRDSEELIRRQNYQLNEAATRRANPLADADLSCIELPSGRWKRFCNTSRG
jgi:hypothetical protein